MQQQPPVLALAVFSLPPCSLLQPVCLGHPPSISPVQMGDAPEFVIKNLDTGTQMRIDDFDRLAHIATDPDPASQVHSMQLLQAGRPPQVTLPMGPLCA